MNTLEISRPQLTEQSISSPSVSKINFVHDDQQLLGSECTPDTKQIAMYLENLSERQRVMGHLDKESIAYGVITCPRARVLRVDTETHLMGPYFSFQNLSQMPANQQHYQ